MSGGFYLFDGALQVQVVLDALLVVLKFVTRDPSRDSESVCTVTVQRSCGLIGTGPGRSHKPGCETTPGKARGAARAPQRNARTGMTLAASQKLNANVNLNAASWTTSATVDSTGASVKRWRYLPNDGIAPVAAM